ncbi:MAG: hypothetical protein QME68_04975, partial [Elusimicrobiota bacterium]|nr:hypothetical protein [Elusimicrobiota bacterium]
DSHRIVADLVYDLISQQPKTIMILSGVEYILFRKLAFRGTIGASDRDWYNFAFGFGVQPTKWLKFHYSLVCPVTGLKNVLTHRLGIDIPFHTEKKLEEKKVKETKKYEPTKTTKPAKTIIKDSIKTIIR